MSSWAPKLTSLVWSAKDKYFEENKSIRIKKTWWIWWSQRAFVSDERDNHYTRQGLCEEMIFKQREECQEANNDKIQVSGSQNVVPGQAALASPRILLL